MVDAVYKTGQIQRPKTLESKQKAASNEVKSWKQETT